MEPDREERIKALTPIARQKPKRFRIVKLEDRIAPSGGGGHTKQCDHSRRTNCCWYYTIDCPW